MADTILNFDDLLALADVAIPIGGTPNKVNATEHRQMVRDFMNSIMPRLQQVATNDLASPTIDWQEAKSNGLIIFPLVDNNFEIDGFTNAIKGDKIRLIIKNDFDFAFDATFKSNHIFYGNYVKSNSVINIVEVECINDDALADQFIVTYKNVTTNPGNALFRDAAAVQSDIVMKTQVVEIGVWDMDATVSVTIDLPDIPDFQKIREVHVLIRQDVNFRIHNLETRVSVTFTGVPGAFQVEDAGGNAQISLLRQASEFFDSPSFDDGAINRGWVTVKYEA